MNPFESGVRRVRVSHIKKTYFHVCVRIWLKERIQNIFLRPYTERKNLKQFYNDVYIRDVGIESSPHNGFCVLRIQCD